MAHSELVLGIVLMLLAIYVFVVCQSPSRSIDDMLADYAIAHLTPAAGFTFDYNTQTGRYSTWYQDKISHNSKYPIDTEGHRWVKNPKQGHIVAESDRGFDVEGIIGTIQCPLGWRWNSTKQRCMAKYSVHEACASKPAGTIVPWYNNLKLAHEKIYYVCGGEGDGSVSGHFEACPLGTKFDVDKRVCRETDLCLQEADGFVFRTDSLQSDEYYICIRGVRALRKCEKDTHFDSNLGGCVVPNRCTNKPDGHTIPESDFSYIACLQGYEIHRPCGPNSKVIEIEVTKDVKTLTCLNPLCEAPHYGRYWRHPYYSYPISAILCRNNQPYEETCQFRVRELTQKIDGSFYPDGKTNWYDERILWADHYIELRDDGTYVCNDIGDDLSRIPNVSKPLLAAVSYSGFLDSANVDLLSEFQPPDKSTRFFNWFGEIIWTESREKVGAARDYLPLMASNQFAQLVNPKLPIITQLTNPADGLTMEWIVESGREKSPNSSKDSPITIIWLFYCYELTKLTDTCWRFTVSVKYDDKSMALIQFDVASKSMGTFDAGREVFVTQKKRSPVRSALPQVSDAQIEKAIRTITTRDGDILYLIRTSSLNARGRFTPTKMHVHWTDFLADSNIEEGQTLESTFLRKANFTSQTFREVLDEYLNHDHLAPSTHFASKTHADILAASFPGLAQAVGLKITSPKIPLQQEQPSS